MIAAGARAAGTAALLALPGPGPALSSRLDSRLAARHSGLSHTRPDMIRTTAVYFLTILPLSGSDSTSSRPVA